MSYPLAIMECMAQEAETTENYKNVTMDRACGARPVRRVVHCDGVRGVLVQRNGRWTVENEQEVRVLAALGGSDRVVDRLRALSATLDAGLIDRAGLTHLNRRLRAISDAENMSRAWIPGELLPAVAFACTFLPHSNGSRWLAWALSARLDSNLFRRFLPGPGWCTMTAYRKLQPWGYDREIRWIDEMPPVFWDRLDARRKCCPPGVSDEHCPSTGGEPCLSIGDQPCLRTVAAASDPRTAPGVLEELARSSDDVVLDLVASHPGTPAHVLLGMVEDRRNEVLIRMRVPQNRSVSPRLLGRMAKSSLWQVRGLAAMNAATPVSVLKQLCGDEQRFVRFVVASHEGTPEEELRILACDHESEVRGAVASNLSCPTDLLERLLADRISSVRSAAVSNPGSPLELVVPRAGDRALGVRAAVALELLAAAPEPHVRYQAGLNSSTPATVLAAVAADSHTWVRRSVAHNADAPIELLEAMVADDDSYVREAVAENVASSAEVLSSLASDERYWVRTAVARNAATPDRALKSLASDDHQGVRVGAALNPSTPDELLAALASDEDYRVRAEAAANLNKRRAPPGEAERQVTGPEER